MADATSAIIGLVPVTMAAGIAMKVTDATFGKSSKSSKSSGFGFWKKK